MGLMKQVDEQNFQEFLQQGKVIVVDFWAPWCMPCLTMAPILEEIEREIKDVSFGKINVDENVPIAQKFMIMSIPTLIFFQNGKEVDRLIGLVEKNEIKEKIARYSGSLSP